MEAPHAARARVLANAADKVTARVLVLSINSGPFDWWCPDVGAGQWVPTDEDAREPRWTDLAGSVNGG
ncbi:hypothetical protein GCM10023162_04600 [Klenkia terrae]